RTHSSTRAAGWYVAQTRTGPLAACVSAFAASSLADDAAPRPLPDGQPVGYVLGGSLIAGHCSRGCPGEVVVQRFSELVVLGKSSVHQCLVETGDRSIVHLLVGAVAAVDPHHRRLVADGGRVPRRPTKCLGPIRGEMLNV